MSGEVGDIDWEACFRCKHNDLMHGCDQISEDDEMLEINQYEQTVVCLKFEEVSDE